MQIHSWTENDHQRENVANKVKQEKAENAGASVHGNQRDNESHEAQDRQHMHSSKVTRGKQIVNEHHESFIFLHQLLGYQLRLPEHRLGGQHLHVGRVAVEPQYPLDNHLQFCFDAFFYGPVDGGVFADFLVEDYGELTELVLLHELPGAVVVGYGGVEGVFVVGKAKLRWLLVHLFYFFGQLDEFFYYFRGGEDLGVVFLDCGFQHLHKGAALDQVLFGAAFDLVVQELL